MPKVNISALDDGYGFHEVHKLQDKEIAFKYWQDIEQHLPKNGRLRIIKR